MRIALVILHADVARGGAERYTFDLGQALWARGHEVDVLSTTRAGIIHKIGHLLETERFIFPARGLSKLSQYLHFLDDVDRHLDATPYDVVHAMLPIRRCDVYHPHAGVAAQAVRSGHLKHASPLKRSVAAFVNRANLKRNRFAAVERELLEGDCPPVVLCLSDYVKETVRRQYPRFPEDRLATLFNAVRLDQFDPANAATSEQGADVRRLIAPPSGGVVGLMVAQDFGRKGLREAIEALAATGDPRIHLAVVGRPDATAYRELAKSLGVGDRVRFVGATSRVYDFYAAADFFVLPTRHDPCSLVVLEALAMGLPVISTKQNGACEIMTSGEHGFVLEGADDREGLIAAMRTMTHGPTRARMRANCLALRPRLAYESHLDTLTGIYRRVARSTPGRAPSS